MFATSLRPYLKEWQSWNSLLALLTNNLVSFLYNSLTLELQGICHIEQPVYAYRHQRVFSEKRLISRRLISSLLQGASTM